MNPFLQDAVTIVFLRNLAFADTVLVLNTVLPTTVSIFFKRWVFGEMLCDVTAHLNFLPVMVNIYIVLYMSVFKILACKFPFRYEVFQSLLLCKVIITCYQCQFAV